MTMLASTRRTALSFFVGALLLLCCAPWPAVAQIAEPDKGAESKDGQPLQKRVAIRFLTDSDYPPFNYFDEDNVLTGFNVDMARAICLELAAACDIQVRPWPELLPALRRGEADAVIASHAVSASALKAVDFTDRYYHTPARFAGKRGAGPPRRHAGRPRGQEDRRHQGHRARGLPARLLPRQLHPRLRDAGAGARCAHQRRGRPAVRRRHQPGLLAQRHGLQGLLRVQGRAVRRAQVLRRRRRHRRQPRGPAAQDADQRGAQAHARERPLRGAAAALFPAARVLSSRAIRTTACSRQRPAQHLLCPRRLPHGRPLRRARHRHRAMSRCAAPTQLAAARCRMPTCWSCR